MPDVTEQLEHYAAAAAETVRPVEVNRVRRRRPRRRTALLVAAAAVAVALATASLAWIARDDPAERVTTDPTQPERPPETSSTTVDPTVTAPLSGRIELAETTVEAGGTIEGRVVVNNNTGEPIIVVGCGSIFQVALANDEIEPMVGWNLCAQDITIPTGESTYPVSVRASYNTCLGESGESTIPMVPCLEDGLPPALPPGDYEARLYQGPEVVPEPSPIEIRVIASP